MNKIIFLILFYLISIPSLNADSTQIKKIYDVKIKNKFSKAIYDINDTNLIDEESAVNNLKKIIEASEAITKKGKELSVKNKNNKSVKHKGIAKNIYKKYSNNVVLIGKRKSNRVVSIGSGLIINHKGLKIITNWHVIDEADSLSIWIKPKKMVDADYLIHETEYYSAELVKFNIKKDLAMLSVENLPIKISKINFGKLKNVVVGDETFVIGHPKEMLWTFDDGLVSQIRPEYSWPYDNSDHFANVIQTSADIDQGNSGGPLFNNNGELIGINTFTRGGENLNFAVAVDDVVEFIKERPKPIKKKENKYIQKKDNGNTWIKKRKKKSDSSNELLIEADYNENGVIDTWLVDDNNNGIYEKVYGDKDEDGNLDIFAIDKNEDKNFELILFDTNGSGNPDEILIDKDEDGNTDFIAYDFNEDGEWDKVEPV